TPAGLAATALACKGTTHPVFLPPSSARTSNLFAPVLATGHECSTRTSITRSLCVISDDVGIQTRFSSTAGLENLRELEPDEGFVCVNERDASGIGGTCSHELFPARLRTSPCPRGRA